nr:hypothetical protein [Tanacetum cinerariifolium]
MQRSNLRKKPHDDQDDLENREGRNDTRRRSLRVNHLHQMIKLCLNQVIMKGNHLTEAMTTPVQDKDRAEPSLTEPKTDNDAKIKINKELLMELHSNTYKGRVEEDVIDHIAKFLESLNLIEIANMDTFQLRMKFFLLSLSGDARKWWMNEGDGKITTWEELVKKFFGKFYPVSCASNYDKMRDDDEEGRDPLEFITWVNSKFKDHKKVDETTKHALMKDGPYIAPSRSGNKEKGKLNNWLKQKCFPGDNPVILKCLHESVFPDSPYGVSNPYGYGI